MLVECLAVHWADSTVEKMALLPVVRKDVNWVDRSVDVKDVRWGVWTEVLMVACLADYWACVKDGAMAACSVASMGLKWVAQTEGR